MSRARELYDWIEASGLETFRNADVAEGLELSGWEATERIRSYVRWQNRKDVAATYVIHRKAGTRGTSSIWVVGTLAEHAKDVGAQLGSDVRRRVELVVRPTLQTIARENPRAKRTTTALENAIGSIVELLVASFAVDVYEDAEV